MEEEQVAIMILALPTVNPPLIVEEIQEDVIVEEEIEEISTQLGYKPPFLF